MSIKSNTRREAESKMHTSQEELPVNVSKIAAEALPATTSSNLPALNTDSRGFESGTDQSDLIIPRAQLLQPVAKGLRQLQQDYGVMAGQVINNLTKTVLPEGFVPIFYFKEYLRFNPALKDAPGFMPEFPAGHLIWRTRDANDPRVKSQCDFGPNGELPLALTSLNFFCIFDNEPMPVILSFTKSSYKTGKNLLSLAKLRGGAMFSRHYKLGVTEGTSDKGSYFVFKVQPAGDCTPEQFKVAESYFNQFAMRREDMKVHTEGIDEIGV